MLRIINLIILSFIFSSCKEEFKETRDNFKVQKKSLQNNQKSFNKNYNNYKVQLNNKQKKNRKPVVELLFPKQKSFSIMKAGDTEARFKFYIDRNSFVVRQGVKLYKVYFSTPSEHENRSFFLGVRKDSLFMDFYDKNFGKVDFFF